VLRRLQDEYFGMVEVQTPERNPAALALFRALGFEHVDTGRVFRRDLG
jgi:ribosomal protein S18 acetylase RimI-like enzyme